MAQNSLSDSLFNLMNPGQLGLGSSRPGSARPGQLGLIYKYIILIVMVKASGADMRQCLYIILILTSYFRPSLP